MKKIKNKDYILILQGIIYVLYLLIDVIHYFRFRIHPKYPVYTEAFYESHYLTFVKWLLLISILIGLYLDNKGIKHSFYVIVSSAVGILLIFFFKGQFSHLLMGSIVFEIGLLEFAAFFSLIYSMFFLTKRYKVSLIYCVLILLVVVGLFFLTIYPSETFIQYNQKQ